MMKKLSLLMFLAAVSCCAQDVFFSLQAPPPGPCTGDKLWYNKATNVLYGCNNFNMWIVAPNGTGGGGPVVFSNQANTYSGGGLQDFSTVRFRPPTSLAAALPPASQHTNEVYEVVDASGPTDCVAGLGTQRIWCISNGMAWISPGGGGGGGSGTVNTGASGQIAYYPGAGTTVQGAVGMSAHGVVLFEGPSAPVSTSPAPANTALLGQGIGSDPMFGAIPNGALVNSAIVIYGTTCPLGVLPCSPSIPFGKIASDVNSSATLTVTSGGAINFSGSGLVNASQVNGVAYPGAPSLNTVPVVTSPGVVTYETLPLAAMPSLAAFSVYGNNTGSTAPPTALPLNGTGNPVATTNANLVTPNIGAATAASVNKLAITPPATGATLTITDTKSMTIDNSLEFAGVDNTKMTFPASSQIIPGMGSPNTASFGFTLNMAGAAATPNAVVVPIGPNLATSAAGAIGFDSVRTEYKAYVNATDSYFATVPASTIVSNGDCATWQNGANGPFLSNAGGCNGGGGVYSASINCISVPTNIPQSLHHQGLTPFVEFRDSANNIANAGIMTLDGAGNLAVSCSHPTVLTIFVSSSANDKVASFPFTSTSTVTIPWFQHGYFAGHPSVAVQAWDNASPRNFLGNPPATFDPNSLTETVTFASAISGILVFAR